MQLSNIFNIQSSASSVKIRMFYLYDKHLSKYYSEMAFIEWLPLNLSNNINITFTDDEDYTHAIILNTYMPILKPGIPKENVIGIALEPPGPPPFLNMSLPFVEYAKKYIHRYFIGDATGLPPPFVGKFVFIEYYSPPKLLTEKKNIMSIMISHKVYAPGHQYRHTLAQEILKRGLPIDIHGNGCKLYNITDRRMKGDFKTPEPMLESYQFHIAIENFRVKHYFSEKIVNPLFFNTIPVYLGCENIEMYLGKCCILLNGNIKHDIEKIEDICRSPEKYKIHIDRKEIFKKVNLLKNLEKEGFFQNRTENKNMNQVNTVFVMPTKNKNKTEIGHIGLHFR